MEYNNHNCKDEGVCEILERLEKTEDVSNILDAICNLPSLISLPKLDEKHIECVKIELKDLLKDDCDDSSKNKQFSQLIDLILFLTYAQYVLELIESHDPVAKYFKNKTKIDIPICRGRIRFWQLVIPSQSILDECLGIYLVCYPKYKTVLEKILIDSRERKIIKAMLNQFYLVEIIDTSHDCSNMNIAYSYIEIDKVYDICDSDTPDLYLYHDDNSLTIEIKKDPAQIIRKLVYEGITPDCPSNNECSVDNSVNSVNGVISSNICIDMSIIILYMGVIVSNCFGIDLLRALDKSDLLNSKIKNRICKN